MRHETHRKKRILFAHAVRDTLRTIGAEATQHHEGFFITKHAVLRPRWHVSRHGIRKLHLHIAAGRLPAHHLGALHLAGLLKGQ